MPIFNAPISNLDINECKRYAGLTTKAGFPDELVIKACLEAQALISPRGIWQTYTYNNQNNMIMADRPIALRGKSITNHLKYAEKIAVMAVTIGPGLESEVTKHFETGDYTLGLLLDAAGTTAVEANADSISLLIEKMALQQGLSPLFRFSPGYGDWDITTQPDILALSGADQINVQATPTCMLLPRKSVTAVIGLIPNTVKGHSSGSCNISSCQNCKQINCLARKETCKDDIYI